MMELLTIKRGYGMNITLDEMQELMPEEIDALYSKYVQMLLDSQEFVLK